MNFITEEILEYAEIHSSPEPALLSELRRETWQKVINPRMLSGVLQGRLLSMLSKIIAPTSILEIGTYTGYSTLCLAEGLDPKGKIITIDKNEELVEFHEKYFTKSHQTKKIKCIYDNALNAVPNLQETFDLVFIDADKMNYSHYFNLVIEKTRKGGIILSDNVLWSGKVIKETPLKDLETKALKEYNELLIKDTRVETLLIPIRDGLTLSRKK